MIWCAEKCYGHTKPSLQYLSKRFKAICGGNYTAHILASEIQGGIKKFQPNMWDGPFWETHFRMYTHDSHRMMAQIADGFIRLASKLKQYRKDSLTGDMKYAYRTAIAFASRYSFATRLINAYKKMTNKQLNG